MDEQRLTHAIQQYAESVMPPRGIDVQETIAKGRRSRRNHLAMLVAGAVAVVLAISTSAYVGLRGGQPGLSAAQLAAANAVTLMVSDTPDRGEPVPLRDQTLSGPAYVFVPTQSADIKGIQFYLDDTTMAKASVSTAWSDPYDLVGTASDGKAQPLDVSRLTTGPHTVTARLLFHNGAAWSITTPFATLGGPTPGPSPTTPVETAPPTNSVAKKWHPGNYLNAGGGQDMSWSISRVTDNPHLKGLSVAHKWIDLEPSKGVYDFSRIADELALMKAAKKQLIIHIWDKTFNGTECVPTYVRTAAYKGGFVKSGSTCVALRWNPAVQDRLNALYTALGKKFDSDPALEAVMLQEDSMMKTSGYSDSGYVTQEKRGMATLAKAFPRTVAFKFLNWGPGIGDLFAYAKSLGLGVGSPELTPEPSDQSSSYPFYPQYAGQIPLQISGQDFRVQASVKAGLTVSQLYDFAVNQAHGLHVNYIIWDQPETPEVSYSKQILPLINARKGLTNTRCPSAIRCQ